MRVPCWAELAPKAVLQLHQEHGSFLEEVLNVFLTRCLDCKLCSTCWHECFHMELVREQLLDLLSQCVCLWQRLWALCGALGRLGFLGQLQLEVRGYPAQLLLRAQ